MCFALLLCFSGATGQPGGLAILEDEPSGGTQDENEDRTAVRAEEEECFYFYCDTTIMYVFAYLNTTIKYACKANCDNFDG